MKLILKKILEITGWSAYRLSENTGISKQVISNWKQRGSRTVNVKHLVAIKRATGLSWSKLGELIEKESELDE